LRLSEEHGILQLEPSINRSTGQRVGLLPSHVCTTVNLHDWYHVLRGGVLLDTWRSVGRGQFQ